MTLRVALVDDHQPFRARLRALLERDRDIDIVAEAGSGDELLEIARTADIDVVCMDIKLPGMSGIETTRRLLAIRPATRVIGLSAFAEPHYVEAMLGAGAVGQFTKGDAGSDELLEAIHTASAERPLFGANIPVPSPKDAMPATAPERPRPSAAGPLLGEREVEVLRMIAKGWTTDAIAHSLSVDTTMVDVYRRNLTRKLNLPDDEMLIDYAQRWLVRHFSDE
jgi:DNA-binding NarL/FixJ family response regulator